MKLYEPNIEELVSADHEYRKLLKAINFEELARPLEKLYSKVGNAGYPISSGLKCLFLQFWLDLSDRSAERFFQENLPAKLFIGVGLRDKTPDHNYFSRLRNKIGAHRLCQIFDRVTESMVKAGIISGTFTFVDASTLHSIVNLWDARDKAIVTMVQEKKENEEKIKKDKTGNDNNNDNDNTNVPTSVMNNSNVGKFSSDKDARFGCKGKSNFWYGYKRHTAVDMGSGMIVKTDATPANITDSQGLEKVCPKNSMVFADKGYCDFKAQEIIKKNKCHSGAILKNNMKGKNFKKDAWLTKVRMPFEGVFSKFNKKTRYRGLEKVRFQVVMQSLNYNLKKLIKLQLPPIELIPA